MSPGMGVQLLPLRITAILVETWEHCLLIAFTFSVTKLMARSQKHAQYHLLGGYVYVLNELEKCSLGNAGNHGRHGC